MSLFMKFECINNNSHVLGVMVFKYLQLMLAKSYVIFGPNLIFQGVIILIDIKISL